MGLGSSIKVHVKILVLSVFVDFLNIDYVMLYNVSLVINVDTVFTVRLHRGKDVPVPWSHPHFSKQKE